MTTPARVLRARAVAAWESYRQALAVGARAWEVMDRRLAWERFTVRLALAELADQGDDEAERRLRLEERED